MRDFDRGHFPYGSTAVFGCIFTDRMRLRLLQAVTQKGENVMNIVVWKSPRALQGLLRRLFRLPKEKE